MKIPANLQKLWILGAVTLFTVCSSRLPKYKPAMIQQVTSDSTMTMPADTVFTQLNDSLEITPVLSRTESLNREIVSDSSDALIQDIVYDSINVSVIDDSTMPQVEFRKVSNEAFQVGEMLEFQIGWKLFKAGTATMTVGDTVWNENRSCYQIKTTANSSSVIDVFYKVRDKVESIIDQDGFFPWKFKKQLREGTFRRDRFTLFDPYQKMAFVKKDTVNIPLYVQDVLSSFYYVRTLPLEVGKHFDIDNISDKKVYPLRILVHKKEQVKVPAGKFNCIVVEPVLRGEGLFNQKGRLVIWLTDDARKMPVMMKSEVFIGTVDIKLTKYKNNINS
ncbi:DUF3108 domain-containing protein [bacterium]